MRKRGGSLAYGIWRVTIAAELEIAHTDVLQVLPSMMSDAQVCKLPSSPLSHHPADGLCGKISISKKTRVAPHAGEEAPLPHPSGVDKRCRQKRRRHRQRRKTKNLSSFHSASVFT